MNGAGLSAVAEFGLNRSPTTHCPLCVGILISLTWTLPNERCICETKKLDTNTTRIQTRRNRLLDRLSGACSIIRQVCPQSTGMAMIGLCLGQHRRQARGRLFTPFCPVDNGLISTLILGLVQGIVGLTDQVVRIDVTGSLRDRRTDAQ